MALLSYPAVTFMDALLARIAFNAITQVMVATVIFTASMPFDGRNADGPAGLDRIAIGHGDDVLDRVGGAAS